MITAEGVYYLFVLAFVFTGAVLREINLMLVLAGMMLGLLIYNFRTARRMTQQATVRRRLPDSATAGEPLAVELTLESKSRSFGIRLIDSVERQDRLDAGGRATVLAPVADAAHGRPATVHYRLILARRGQYRFGPLQVRSAYPFGLVRRTVEHQQAGTLLVFPRLGVLTAAWGALVEEAAHGSQRQRHQSYSAGDFYGLRDYRSGDSRRHIHWRTSARRGNLMVRQFERAVHQDIALCLDLWQPEQAGDEGRAHIERAVSFAATLVSQLCRRGGCNVWFSIAGTGEKPLQGAASMSLSREAMVRLARAEPVATAMRAEACISTLAHAPPRALRVLLTTRPPDGPASLSPHRRADLADNNSQGRLVVVSTRQHEFAELFQCDVSLGQGI